MPGAGVDHPKEVVETEVEVELDAELGCGSGPVEKADDGADVLQHRRQQRDDQQGLPHQGAIVAAVESEEVRGPVHAKGSGRKAPPGNWSRWGEGGFDKATRPVVLRCEAW